MKHGKKVLALLVCVAMTAVLAVGCGGSSKSALDEIKEKGQLVWGTNAQFPPFESKERQRQCGRRGRRYCKSDRR